MTHLQSLLYFENFNALFVEFKELTLQFNGTQMTQIKSLLYFNAIA